MIGVIQELLFIRRIEPSDHFHASLCISSWTERASLQTVCAGSSDGCLPGFPSAQRWRLACTVLPCLGWLVQFPVTMEDVLGYLLFWQKRVSVLGTLRHCPVWRVLCKKFCFFCFLVAHHLIWTKERMLQWRKGKGTVAPLFPCRYWLLDILRYFDVFKGYIFWTVFFCQSELETSWAQSCVDGCPSGRAQCRVASGQVPHAVLGNLQLGEEGAPSSEFQNVLLWESLQGWGLHMLLAVISFDGSGSQEDVPFVTLCGLPVSLQLSSSCWVPGEFQGQRQRGGKTAVPSQTGEEEKGLQSHGRMRWKGLGLEQVEKWCHPQFTESSAAESETLWIWSVAVLGLAPAGIDQRQGIS